MTFHERNIWDECCCNEKIDNSDINELFPEFICTVHFNYKQTLLIFDSVRLIILVDLTLNAIVWYY